MRPWRKSTIRASLAFCLIATLFFVLSDLQYRSPTFSLGMLAAGAAYVIQALDDGWLTLSGIAGVGCVITGLGLLFF